MSTWSTQRVEIEQLAGELQETEGWHYGTALAIAAAALTELEQYAAQWDEAVEAWRLVDFLQWYDEVTLGGTSQ